jgi:hypothetical protein
MHELVSDSGFQLIEEVETEVDLGKIQKERGLYVVLD